MYPNAEVDIQETKSTLRFTAGLIYRPFGAVIARETSRSTWVQTLSLGKISSRRLASALVY